MESETVFECLYHGILVGFEHVNTKKECTRCLIEITRGELGPTAASLIRKGSNTERSRFIVVEGVDRAGNTLDKYGGTWWSVLDTATNRKVPKRHYTYGDAMAAAMQRNLGY